MKPDEMRACPTHGTINDMLLIERILTGRRHEDDKGLHTCPDAAANSSGRVPICRAGNTINGRWKSWAYGMRKLNDSHGQSASELISKKIAELGDWRGKTLARMRKLIQQADPNVVEEWKWMGTPVWSHDGILCTGESYKHVVKLTFAKGASLKDPSRLFNSSLDGNVRRAIDIHQGEEVKAMAFKALVRQAVALNRSAKSKSSKKANS